MDPDIGQGGTAEDRNNTAVQGSNPQSRSNLFVGQGFTFQVFHHQFVIGFRYGFDEFFPIAFCLGLHVSRYLFNGEVLSFLRIIKDGLHVDQVNDPAEVFFTAYGQLHGHGPVGQLFLHLGQGLGEIGIFPVQLVYKYQAGQVILVGKLPDLFRVHFNSGNGTNEDHRPIHHPKGAPYITDKIGVSGGVDQVYFVLLPVAGGQGGIDGNFSLYLIGVIINYRGPVIYPAQPIRCAGVKEHCFRQGCFTSSTVGDQPHITQLPNIILFHIISPLLCFTFCIPEGLIFALGQSISFPREENRLGNRN